MSRKISASALSLTLACALNSLPSSASVILTADEEPPAPLLQVTTLEYKWPNPTLYITSLTASTLTAWDSVTYTAPTLDAATFTIDGNTTSSGTLVMQTSNFSTPSAVPLIDSALYFSAALLPLVARLARRRR